jgi:hypothetical protein
MKIKNLEIKKANEIFIDEYKSALKGDGNYLLNAGLTGGITAEKIVKIDAFLSSNSQVMVQFLTKNGKYHIIPENEEILIATTEE